VREEREKKGRWVDIAKGLENSSWGLLCTAEKLEREIVDNLSQKNKGGNLLRRGGVERRRRDFEKGKKKIYT